MVKIYCIEDINDLKYVGSTTQLLKDRLCNHRSDKKSGRTVSSCKLDLDNCKIYELEECSKDLRKEREKHWINEIDCVNQYKLNGPNKEKLKEYDREYAKRYRQKNKEKMRAYDKLRYQKRKLLKLSDQKNNLS